jgi:Ca-activated chloride channel homolog
MPTLKIFRHIVLALVVIGTAALSLDAKARREGGGSGQSPEAPAQLFRSAVDVVTIQASVRDKRGRAVPRLTADDFEVRDNGELRPVLSVGSDERSPLTVAFLVDMSGSMSVGPKIDMARRAFDALLVQLRPFDDEAAVFTFDSSSHERRGFTPDIGSLQTSLSDFRPYGTTSLYDATAATARQLSQRSGGRKAIIVLTDGIDTSSTMTATQVSGLASSIDAPVYVIATVPSIDERLMIEATERGGHTDAVDLRDLAEWTGGRLVFASTFAEATAAAANLITELRQQYVIAIEAAAHREWRRLDVRVKRSSAVVKARSGYYGG